MDDNIFTEYESDVRSYCRKWPVIFDKAKGSIIETSPWFSLLIAPFRVELEDNFSVIKLDESQLIFPSKFCDLAFNTTFPPFDPEFPH